MIQWRNSHVRLSGKCWIYRAVVPFYILVYNLLPRTLILIIFSGIYKLILFSFPSKVWTRSHYRPNMNTLLVIALSLIAAGKKILQIIFLLQSLCYAYDLYIVIRNNFADFYILALARCPADWDHYNDRCFFLSRDNETFADALVNIIS